MNGGPSGWTPEWLDDELVEETWSPGGPGLSHEPKPPDVPDVPDVPEADVPDRLPSTPLPIKDPHTEPPSWVGDAPIVGESTEEIPVVGTAAAAAGGGAEAAQEGDAAPQFGRAGSLLGLKFNGRRAVQVLVMLVWGLALLAIGVLDSRHLHALVPNMDRWVAYAAGVVCLAVAFVLIANVDEPDVVEIGEEADFHELSWTRRQLFRFRKRDVIWLLVEISPLLLFLPR